MVDGRPARPAAERTVEIDDDRARVGRRNIAPGAGRALGAHELAVVAVESKDCSFR